MGGKTYSAELSTCRFCIVLLVPIFKFQGHNYQYIEAGIELLHCEPQHRHHVFFRLACLKLLHLLDCALVQILFG